MFTNWQEVQQQKAFRIKNEINLGLERLSDFLEKLGNPQDKLKAIHIGGTNGKGSTLRFLEGILLEHGYQVGVFHSPAYLGLNDQISVDQTDISDDEMLRIIDIFNQNGLEDAGLTEFELQTAMAFYYFAEMNSIDFAIIEVGLGGREDSTNVVNPILSIITNVGLDHLGFLGDSIEKIAYQKAGIIKLGIPVVTGVSQKVAKDVIKLEAESKQAPCYIWQEHFSVDIKEEELSLQGSHQLTNAGLAVKGFEVLVEEGFAVSYEEKVGKGLLRATHPGRFEVLQENPWIILDGAHNEEAVGALISSMKTKFAGMDVHVIFAALKDKPLDKMIEQLDGMATEITFTSFDFPRAENAEKLFLLSKHPKKAWDENWQKAIDLGIKRLKNNAVLVITGSLYFLQQTRTYLLFDKKT